MAKKSTVKAHKTRAKSHPVQRAHGPHPINHAAPHKTVRAQTLKRSIVSKPTASFKRNIQISSFAEDAHGYPMQLSPEKTLIQDAGKGIITHAALVKKSSNIVHFAPPSSTTQKVATRAVTAPIKETIIPKESPKRESDILFENAMDQSTSHENTFSKKRSKVFSFGLFFIPIAVLAIALIGALNVNKVELHIASNKVGFTTAIPHYQPAGYSLNQISYKKGLFATEFKNIHTAANYIVTQSATSWDSQTLLNNYVALTGSRYQVVTIGTRTVYLFGDGSAAWISGGVWYQIASNGTLSESQLINVANSL